MGIGCAANTARLILFIFNSIFFLLGGACLGVGIFVLVDKKELVALTKIDGIDKVDAPSLLEQGAYVLIAAGAVVFLVGFLGCCGACIKSTKLLYLYAAFIVIVFIIEIVGGILGYKYKDDVEIKLESFLNETILQKYTGILNETGESFNLAWNFAMITYECCGANGYKDFEKATKWTRTNYYGVPTAQLPIACCKLNSIPTYPDTIPTLDSFKDPTNCLDGPDATNSNYMKGCYSTIKDKILSQGTLVLGIGIGIGVVQLFGIIFACCLIRAIKDD